MSLDMDLVGNAMQMAVVRLAPGQTVYSEAGKFLFSSGNLQMETKLGRPDADGGAPAGGGGMLGGVLRTAMDAGKRMVAGESIAFQHFTNRSSAPEVVAFAGVIPGEMRALELDGSCAWFAEKDAFVAAEAGVDFDIAFTGMRQGLSGGEGFILEKFSGRGTVLIAGAGNFIDVNPADFGGKLKVDTGCIVAFEDGVRYGVERVGRLSADGMMTAVLGGEGLSLATLEGNGRVILQSMTLEGLANALRKASTAFGGTSNGQTGLGALGGLLGGSSRS